MTLGTPTIALVEPIGATRPLGVFTRGARALLLGGALVSCAGSGTRNAADATAPVDLGVVNDLSPPPDQGRADASADDALDVLDASADLPGELGADARSDAGVDADVPTDRPPGVTLGDVFVPVDPSAVPPPGSECTADAGVRAGDPSIAPPRPLRPLSVSRVTSQRPTFQWALPEGTTGARVEVCADRCCTRVLQTLDAEGSTVRPTVALPPGVAFWRMFGRRGGDVGSRPSYTWEFGVRRRDAPGDTSWGTIRDFNGDGYDDVLVMRAVPLPVGGPSLVGELWLAAGSDRGLQVPVATGIRNDNQPFLEGVGDFNGDGIADTLIWEWSSRPSRYQVILGGPAGVGLRVSRTLDLRSLGRCTQLVTACIVDWNGDGYSDVIVSSVNVCDGADGRPSLLLGYHGSRSGIAAVPQWVVQTDALFTHPAVEIFRDLGDLDNDGYGDIYLLNRPTSADTRRFPERQYIAHGAPGPTPRYELIPDPMLEFDQPPWASLSPYSIGDIDADGFGDLALIGRSGAAFVYRHATGVARPSAILVAPRRGGFADACPCDFNGDGIADMVASSPFSSEETGDPIPVDVGRVYAYFGDPRGELRDPIWIDRAEQDPRDGYIRHFGASVSCGSDVDGDGFDDVVMTDDLGLRLCTRNGGMGLRTAHPDSCFAGAVTIGTRLLR